MVGHIIDSLVVDGFQGYRRFSHKFDPRKNFFIGRNGTGKTQLITLIKAALSADTNTMYEIKFDRLRLALRAEGERKKTYITYEKFQHGTGRGEIDGISVQLKRGLEDEGITYFTSPDHISLFEPMHEKITNRIKIQSTLRDLIDFNWLSLIRGEIYIPDEYEIDEQPVVRDPVSQKVEENSFRVAALFSEFDRSSNKLVTDFQRNFLLSYLDSSMDEKVFNSIGNLNSSQIIEAKEDILDAFNRLDLPEVLYIDKIERHFKRAQNAIEKYQKMGSIEIKELGVLIDSLRLARLASSWRSTQEQIFNIYKDRDKFVKILSRLFFHKEANLTRGNKIGFEYHNDFITLDDLSSGEKQMFIGLSEALLQRNMPVIFLADEPELSMHIEWQLDLVKNIRELNSECQIVFATHSPEIVANHQDHIFDMEAF